MKDEFLEEDRIDKIGDSMRVDDDIGDYEESRTQNPPQMDSSTFRQRNDPKELLERIRLDIMNAYIDEVEETGEDGIKRRTRKFKKKKDTKPKANSQGISDIMSYIDRLVNSHTVQANITGLAEYRNRMRHISSDIIMHFTAHRTQWGISKNDLDELIGSIVNLVDLFLTRGLDDKERSHYSDGFTERTLRDIRPQVKPNIFQRGADALSKMFG